MGKGLYFLLYPLYHLHQHPFQAIISTLGLWVPGNEIQGMGENRSVFLWMATPSSILAWKIPWTKEPGRLQSMGSQRVRRWLSNFTLHFAAAACPTLCDPIDGSPPGSPVPGILQARTLEWVAISFSNAWKWSCSVVSNSSWPHGLQPTRLLRPWDFPGKSTGVGCHCLLHFTLYFLWNPQASFHCSLLGESICDLWVLILSSQGHLQGHWSLRISYSFPWKVTAFRRAQVNS